MDFLQYGMVAMLRKEIEKFFAITYVGVDFRSNAAIGNIVLDCYGKSLAAIAESHGFIYVQAQIISHCL